MRIPSSELAIVPARTRNAGVETEVVDELGKRLVEFVEVRRKRSAQSLEALSRQFLGWCKLRRSPQTVAGYAVALEQFCEFAFDNGIDRPADVDHEKVEAWLAWLIAKGVKPVTANARLAALRTLWKWMRRSGIVVSNPPADCERLKTRKKVAQYLPVTESEKLLAGLAMRSGDVARRDEALVATALFAGLRCSELVGLRIDQVNLDDGFLRVVGKGDKERELPLSERLVKLLRTYITETRPRLLTPRPLSEMQQKIPAAVLRHAYATAAAAASPWVFVSTSPTLRPATAPHTPRQWGAQLCRHSFNMQLAKLGRLILGKPIHPHQLRHSCAARMRNNGADLETIAAALGHESIETTRIYAHVSTERRRQMLQELLR